MKAIYRNLLVALIFLMAGAVSAFAQPTLKGKVTDENGQPLPGKLSTSIAAISFLQSSFNFVNA